MRVLFAKQISLSAHTWTHLILEPYFQNIPSYIATQSKDLKEV